MARIASLLLGCAAALAAAPGLAQQYGVPDMGYGYGPMAGWYSGMLFGPVLWLLVVLGAFAIFAHPRRWFGHPDGRRGALDLLEERFARGEIDKAEFEEKRKLLGR